MRLVKQFYEKSLKLRVKQFQHTSGGQLIHIERDAKDPSAVAIGFATPVSDSKGTPHILEHLALCGSQKFPVKDPFFKMLNRSQASYMNAWTFSDMTIYPFSSPLAKDVVNLRDIYADACFNPLLRKKDFEQEGWRLSADKIEGVVYNEMKGVYSSSNALFYYRMLQNLFEGTQYGHVSGGDPQHIPFLGYDELVKYHRTHYSPSNAVIFTFGSQYPLDDHLKYFGNLFDGSVVQQLPEQPSLKLWSKNRVVRETFQAEPMQPLDKQNKVAVSYVIPNNSVQDGFNLSILENMLLHGQSSPMYKALVSSGLGTTLGSGVSSYGNDSVLTIGLTTATENIEKVQEVIQQTLQHCVASSDWLQQDRIDALLHQVELNTRSPVRDLGIDIAPDIIGKIIHGKDLQQWFDIGGQVANFKWSFDGGALLQEMLRCHTLDNSHKLTLIMTPDTKYNDRLQSKESQLFKSMLSKTPSQVQAGEAQPEQDDVSMLPTVSIQHDIKRKAAQFEIQHMQVDQYPIQSYVGVTNELSFVNGLLELPEIPIDLRPYLPLFTSLLTKVGTSAIEAAKLEQIIQSKTSGISFKVNVGCDPTSIDSKQESLGFYSYSLPQNVPQMYELIQQCLTDANLNNQKVIQNIIERKARSAQSSISSQGNRFASLRSGSVLSGISSLRELSDGLTQVELLNKLTSQGLDETVVKLKQLQSIILSKLCSRFSVHTSSPELLQKNFDGIRSVAQAASLKPQTDLDSFKPLNFLSKADNVFVESPFQSSFASRAVKVDVKPSKESVYLGLLCRIVSDGYLHRQIREINGAYGSGCNYNASTGCINFSSYRDPMPFKSLETFKGAFSHVEPLLTPQKLEEAKLAELKMLDAPLKVNQYGSALFFNRVTHEMVQMYRDYLLDATLDDLKLQLDSIKQDTAAQTVIGVGQAPQDWIVKRLT